MFTEVHYFLEMNLVESTVEKTHVSVSKHFLLFQLMHTIIKSWIIKTI